MLVHTSEAISSLYSLDFKSISMNVSKGTFSIILPLSSPSSLRFTSSIVLDNESPDEILYGVLSASRMRAFGVLGTDIVSLKENVFRVE